MQEHLPNPANMELATFVRKQFEGKTMHFSKPALTRQKQRYMYAYCKHHANEEGVVCKAKYKFVEVGYSVHEYAKGQHFDFTSLRSERSARRTLAREMAGNPIKASAQIRRRIAKGEDPESLPEPEAIWRMREDARRELRADGGVTPAELEAAVRSMERKEGDPPWRMVADQAHSDLGNNVVVLCSQALLQDAVSFAARASGPLRLCCDATHDLGLQQWKLLSIGFLGVHQATKRNEEGKDKKAEGRKKKAKVPEGEWSVTFVPLAFAAADEEKIGAATALIDSVSEALLQEHGLDLQARVGDVFLDGGAALLSAFGEAFPQARVTRCLQHVKKNIMDASRRWKGKNRGVMVKHWVDQSAFLPPGLFDFFWRHALTFLRHEGEGSFADYMLREHLQLADQIQAPWNCGMGCGTPPFSAYSSNAIESLWKVMDDATDDLPKRIDLLSEFKYLEEVCRAWHAQKRFLHVQYELPAGKVIAAPDPGLLRGRGKRSCRGALEPHKALARLTARGLVELAQETTIFIEKAERPSEFLKDFLKVWKRLKDFLKVWPKV